jgi:cell surface protein SprA
MANNQVTLTKGNEFVVGTGYKFKNLKLFKVGPDRRQLQSDLDVRTDFSIRDNLTVIRLISDGSNQVTSGQNIWSLKITADYRISRSLNVQAYFDRVFTKPKTSASYPTGNTNAGISLRFNLAQ